MNCCVVVGVYEVVDFYEGLGCVFVVFEGWGFG